MLLSSGASKMQHAMKELRVKWEDTSIVWNDSVSRSIQEDVLEPMRERMTAVQLAISRLSDVLEKAKRECDCQ